MPAQFGFIALIPPVYINASVRNDGGLSVTIPNISQALPLTGTSLTFWGVPADPAHDADRGAVSQQPRPDGALPLPGAAAAVPHQPDLVHRPGDHPPARHLVAERRRRASQLDHARWAPTAATTCRSTRRSTCSRSSPSSDSPTGLSVDVNVPQPQNPTGIAESNLKKAVVTLPEGTTINPAAADGLAGCTQAQIGLANTADPSCPNASKIGSVADRQPAAARSAAGRDLSGDPEREPVRQPAGDLHRRPGRRRDRQARPARSPPTRPTGQVTATIDNAPQLPFSQFSLSFFGGPRGVLATPTTCGTKTATAEL